MSPEKISARLADHPTVRKVLSRKSEKPGVIDADWLRQVCLDAGADDVAFASVENPDLAGEQDHVDAALPGTQSYISLVVKMNRDNVRSTARSVANQEFHRSGEIMNEAAHRITRALQDAGTAQSTRRCRSRWRWIGTPAASGWSRTSRLRWRQASG